MAVTIEIFNREKEKREREKQNWELEMIYDIVNRRSSRRLFRYARV
jgi:hypothetical protein